MLQILLLLICSAMLAMAINKKIELILPSVVMLAGIGVYSFGILKLDLRIASYFVMGACVVVAIASLVIAFLKCNKNAQIIKDRLNKNVVTIPIIICLVTCVIFAFMYSTHRLYDWDDMSYWGIYVKDLFFLNRIPLGVENCTVSYKDYNPIMQILEYFFMLGEMSFDEARPFQINVCFMYILMLPFLKKVGEVCDRRRNGADDIVSVNTNTNVAIGVGDSVLGKDYVVIIASIIMYLTFPHIFSTQVYYKLGVDYLMSLLFGYGIYVIVDAEHEEWFRIIRLIIVGTFVTMIKTSGVVLMLFLVLFYIVYRYRSLLGIIIDGIMIGVVPMIYYLSWKLWGRRTGNNGYLSDKVESNVKSLAHIFPSYTGNVILNYIKHIFICELTREKRGITVFLIILACVAVYYARKRAGKVALTHKRLHIALFVGLFIFCLAHIYMYLFVFDDWEAFGLLEFDKYINQYLAGVFFYYMMNLWEDGLNAKLRINPAITIMVVFAVCFPYGAFNQYLIPSNYTEYYSANYQGIYNGAENEWNESVLKQLSLPLDDDSRVMLMGNGFIDEYQFLVVSMVPQAVTVLENIPAIAENTVTPFAKDIIRARGIDYVYVTKGVDEFYVGDFAAETTEFTVDGKSLECGGTYKVIREDDEIWLEKLN